MKPLSATETAETSETSIETPTVCRTFLDSVANHPDRVALRSRNADGQWNELTYSAMADEVARLAAALPRNARVGLLLGNRPEHHVLDLAVLFAGGTPISLYTSSSPEQLAFMIEHASISLVFTDDPERLHNLPIEVITLDTPAYEAFRTTHPIDLEAAAATIEPSDLATIIYTSGTTARPKGVCLTHTNIAAVVRGFSTTAVESCDGMRVVSYLPMAHIAERMMSYYLAIACGMTVTTCPNPANLRSYLLDVRPQLFLGVPRVWEKLHAGVQQQLRGHPLRRRMFDAARRLKLNNALAKVRRELGLDEVVFAASGAAPLPVEIAEWFRSIGIPLTETYGMSETCGPLTWNPHAYKRGTVGRSLPGCEIRLLPDGEIVCRGESIFDGYLDDDQATSATLIDGWLHTGDLGEFDADGTLRIVGRKKDLIITAGGKNISPAAIESALNAHPAIAQSCVTGDRRPYLSAIITIDSTRPLEEVYKDLETHIAEVNAKRSKPEQIKRFTIVEKPWIPGSEVLTATGKVKRQAVEQQYRSEIEAMYAKPTTPVTKVDSRDRYVDFLRVFSIGAVVFGHWLMAVPRFDGHAFSASNAVSAIPGLWAMTWLLQVMPLFFFVGGFSNATSLISLQRRGGGYQDFLLRRSRRLLRPVVGLFAVWIALTTVFALAGASGTILHRVTTWVAQPMWFVAVYLLVVAMAPTMWKLHRRFGVRVVLALAVGALLVDVARFGFGVGWVGAFNLLLVWNFAHQLGFFYADGSLQSLGAKMHKALCLLGFSGLILLTTVAHYPQSMVGQPGDRFSNMNPPTLAILALTVWLLGLAMLLRAPITAWLQRPRVWSAVITGNVLAMTVFCWHMTALIIAVFVTYPLGFPQPEAGTVLWWTLRPVWFMILATVLFGLVTVFRRFDTISSKNLKASDTRSSRLTFLALPGTITSAIAIGGFALTSLYGIGLAEQGRSLGVMTISPTHNLVLLAFGLASLQLATQKPLESNGHSQNREKTR